MAKRSLYTFGEVVKELGISSNQVNELIAAGKLKPVRQKEGCKFKKENLEQIKKERAEKLAAAMKAIKEQREKKFYSWEEVLCELQMEAEGIKKWIDNGEIQAYEGKDGLKFNKKEVDKLKLLQQNKATMIVAPESKSNLNLGLEQFSAIFQELELQPKAPEEYYKFDQVLTILQMEPKELERMVKDGDLTIINSPEGVKYKKSEIELLRQERMIEATVVVQPENIIEEDEEIVPIVISAGSEGELAAIEPEEFYTFDEAAYELQVDISELKRMIARQEIDAIEDNGGFKFRKADIDERHQDIEPTIILPEELEQEKETEQETFPLLREIKEKNPSLASEKSFCSISKAAKYLKVSENRIQRWIKDKVLRAYIMQGKKKLKIQDVRKFKEQRKARAKAKSASLQENIHLQQEYYSMEETIKLLRVDKKELKILVVRGKLEVMQSGKGYLFLKSSVDYFARKKKKTVEKLEAQDLFLSQQTGKKNWEKPEPEMTMVLPLTDEEEEIEKPTVLKTPSSKKARSIKIVEDTMMLPLDKPPIKPKRAELLTTEELEAKLRESDKKRDALNKKYYTQPQALMALNITPKELEKLVAQGTLKNKKIDGRVYFNREKIDELQKGKMIEPTIMVGDEDGDDLLDDEDDIFFLNNPS